jgi:NDP-sugar pyrophosphorylase family protein
LQYGDVVTDADLKHLLARHDESGGLATLLYYDSPQIRDKGLLELADDGRVVGFVEKTDEPVAVGHVNAGIHALDPEILEFVPPGGDFGFDVWPAVAAAGRAIFGHETTAYVCDIGTEDALRRAETDLARGAFAW